VLTNTIALGLILGMSATLSYAQAAKPDPDTSWHASIIFAGWTAVGTGSDGTMYFARPPYSVGATRRMWVRIEHSSPNYSDGSYHGLSETDLREFVCAEQKSRFLAYTEYRLHNNEEPISNHVIDFEQWSYPAPDTIGGELLKMACTSGNKIQP